MLHDVHDGQFDPMFVSLNFINGKYPEVKLGEYNTRQKEAA